MDCVYCRRLALLCHTFTVVLTTDIIWNNLPASLRDEEVSCTEFRRQLNSDGLRRIVTFDYCAL